VVDGELDAPDRVRGRHGRPAAARCSVRQV